MSDTETRIAALVAAIDFGKSKELTFGEVLEAARAFEGYLTERRARSALDMNRLPTGLSHKTGAGGWTA